MLIFSQNFYHSLKKSLWSCNFNHFDYFFVWTHSSIFRLETKTQRDTQTVYWLCLKGEKKVIYSERRKTFLTISYPPPKKCPMDQELDGGGGWHDAFFSFVTCSRISHLIFLQMPITFIRWALLELLQTLFVSIRLFISQMPSFLYPWM